MREHVELALDAMPVVVVHLAHDAAILLFEDVPPAGGARLDQESPRAALVLESMIEHDASLAGGPEDPGARSSQSAWRSV